MELGLPLTRAAGTARPGRGIQETLRKKKGKPKVCHEQDMDVSVLSVRTRGVVEGMRRNFDWILACYGPWISKAHGYPPNLLHHNRVACSGRDQSNHSLNGGTSLELKSKDWKNEMKIIEQGRKKK